MAQGKKTGGRRPGSLNKTTVAVKEALRLAFEEMGGAQALVKWGRENPTQFYQLWGKLIPTEVALGASEDLPAIAVTFVEAK